MRMRLRRAHHRRSLISRLWTGDFNGWSESRKSFAMHALCQTFPHNRELKLGEQTRSNVSFAPSHWICHDSSTPSLSMVGHIQTDIHQVEIIIFATFSVCVIVGERVEVWLPSRRSVWRPRLRFWQLICTNISGKKGHTTLCPVYE